MTVERWVTFNRRTAIMPWLLLIGLIVLSAWRGNYWPLLGVPGIYVGWLCAAPNFNLADGCLTLVTVLVSWLLALWLSPLFILAIVTFAAWFACSLEFAIRAKPFVPAPDGNGVRRPG